MPSKCIAEQHQTSVSSNSGICTANDQIPEYIKQALQNESYAKVPGMRSFQYQLATSLPGAVTRIERARFGMLEGKVPGARGVKAIKADLELAKKGELTDTRDWDLMPTIGGNLPDLKDLTKLGNSVGAGWVRAWGSTLLAITALENTAVVWDEVPIEGVSFRIGLLPKDSS